MPPPPQPSPRNRPSLAGAFTEELRASVRELEAVLQEEEEI